MSTSVEDRLNYNFVNSKLMEDALRAAHRSDQDGSSHDGNRGLAHYGILAMQIAETHDSIMEKKITLHDFNTQQHWSKTKKGRAKACSSLGIEASIKQSVRQGDQRPSDTVLDNALSALLGAVWLDCEGQGKSTATTRRKISEVLRNIDAALSSPAPSPARDTEIDAFDLLAEQGQDPVQDTIREWWSQAIGDMHDTSNSATNILHESEMYVNEPGGIWFGEDLFQHDYIQIASPPSTDGNTVRPRPSFSPQGSLIPGERPNTTQGDVSAMDVTNAHDDPEVLKNTGAKRKRPLSRMDKADSLYQDILDSEYQKLACHSGAEAEMLRRFLKHPRPDAWDGKTSKVLHFLWLGIGNWQTISDFKDQLQLARNGPQVYKPADTSTWSAIDTYSEICRLEDENSLNTLLLRYHAIQLCKEESFADEPHEYILVETPSTIGTVGRSTPGNPNMKEKALRTDELVSKIMPTLQRGSSEFTKVRNKVKRLQKLALRLNLFVDSYGLGILGLLPSGASFGEMSLSNRMLTAIDETTLRDFVTCLQEEQGSLLHSLSSSLEPAVRALLTYSLDASTQYLVECIDLSVHTSQPKGLLRLC